MSRHQKNINRFGTKVSVRTWKSTSAKYMSNRHIHINEKLVGRIRPEGCGLDIAGLESKMLS